VKRRPRRRTGVSYARLVNRNDVILGIAAAVLVGFALVVSLVLPRRSAGFPGRHLGAFLLVAALLVVGMLTSVEVLGESHHFAAAGESEGAETGQGPTTSAPTGTTPSQTAPTETSGGGPSGDPAAGKQVFTATAQPPCATCHTLSEAGATGQVGPNLDDVLAGKSPDFIHESIVDPDAMIASGFTAGVMPKVYGDQLNDQQLADLVAFLVQATS
jgi:mono/diheme cytochrome c family protein